MQHFLKPMNIWFFVYPHDITFPLKRMEKQKSKPFLKTGRESERFTGKNCFYPIIVKNGEIHSFGEVPSDNFHPGRSIIKKEDLIEIWPITEDGKERKWRYARNSLKKIEENLYISDLSKKANSIMLMKEEELYKTVWTENIHNIAEYGNNLLKKFFGADVYTYPKSVETSKTICSLSLQANQIVLDFFAGSGTTAHAVMKLNKEDGGRRKYILIEMADYFDTVIIPRLKKVCYSFNWKDGKPQDADGISQIIKYHYLEQYEDTLHNIEFPQEEKGQKLLQLLPEEAKREYLMKYILRFETEGSPSLLNLEQFESPFDYELKIISSGKGEETVNVDLIETFNYLIGLNIKGYRFLNENGKKYVIVLGERNNRKVAVIWRKTKNINLEKDKKIIEDAIKKFSPDEIFVNGDSFVRNYKPIENEFRKLMGV